MRKMKVKDIMEKPVFVSPSATKKELFALAKKHPNVELFIVADARKKFLGDINENDLFYMLLPNELYDEIGIELAFDLEKKFFAKKAKDLMRKHDVSCNVNDDILIAAIKLAKEEINEMIVLDNFNHVVGVVNQGTFLRYLKT